ncbi:MAG: FAD-binding protein [Clostridiales bacterium]|nr:FAD-binding protein [Clostridiales bacterium]
MSAAIEAVDQGLDVILLEKLSIVGGTTTMASTAYNAGGMEIQLNADPPYTADDAYDAWIGDGEDDPYLRLLSDRSGETGDWLVAMGADLGQFNGKQVMTSDGSALGNMLVTVLNNNIKDKGVDLRTRSEAVALITDNSGAVTGVTVEDADGTYDIYADAVILATGGFASNPEMVDEYCPSWSGYPSTASVGATGDGITMGLDAGAAIADMGNAGPQSVAYDTGSGAISLTNVRYNGAILVNRSGNRFVNESGPSMPIAAAITEQDGGYAYLIFDQASVDGAALMQTYKDRGYFTQADTLEELADALELDAETLAATVEKYQVVYDTGVDEEFGRSNHIFSRLDQAPYYGVQISPANQTTYGGLVIDLETRVLREDQTVIAGLYAAGEVTACQGSGTTIAAVLGKLAAETVTNDIAENRIGEEERFVPGTYKSTAQGNNGPVTVAVTMSAYNLCQIMITDHQETIGIGTDAFDILSKEMIEKQSVSVDSISSATMSSAALRLAVSDCVEQAGGVDLLRETTSEEDKIVYGDDQAEFVIIGAGGAGMSAAIHAGELGLDVILVEKMDLVGGTTAMAGVGVNAGGSSVQTDYTTEDFYNYLISIGKGVDEKGKSVVPLRQDYARAFADHSAEMVDWMIEIGVPLYALDNSHSHQMTTTENGLFGEVLVEKLKEQLDKQSTVEVRTGNEAVEIIMEDGAVSGVVIEYDGGSYTIATNNVLIATGGYGSGSDVIAEYAPDWVGYPSTEAISATGDGIRLALEAGGTVSDMDAITSRPLAIGYDEMGGAIGAQNAPKAGVILVNQDGKRFVNELSATDVLTNAVKEQEGNCAYIIITQEMLDDSTVLQEFSRKGVFKQASSLEELAGILGIDPDGLVETAEAYNLAAESGNDADFGRTGITCNLSSSTYYGVKAKPSRHICTGGIDINGNAQVLNAGEEAIPGLYAAGEVTNHGNHPVSSAVVFGRIAAEEVAERVR